MTIHKINYLQPLQGVATKRFLFDKKTQKWMLLRGYQAGKEFNGFSHSVNNIEEAFEILKKYQNSSVFMIQGDFIEGISLKKIRRIKRADRGTPTLIDRDLSLICFDVDGWESDCSGRAAIEMFIQELPPVFWEADYIYQFSASSGLFDEKLLKCHLFFWFEKPIPSRDIRAWVIEYNKEKEWGNILDPAVHVATQPVYTQRRICEGAPDPITDFLGIVKKSGSIGWKPPAFSSSSFPLPSSRGRKNSANPYSFHEGIRDILTATSFHDSINKMSLSLMGKGMTAALIKETIRGLMHAAKENIKDPKRLSDWQVRFDDIDRSVDSAFNIVDNPSQIDLLVWLKVAPKEIVLKEFSTKTFKKSAGEIKEIIEIVAERTGVDKRVLKKRVKGFKEKVKKSADNEKREALSKKQKREGVHAVLINEHNYALASKKVAEILRDSKRWPPVFAYGPSLAYINFAKIITIRQMAKKKQMEDAGERYCRTPIISNFVKPFHDLISRLGQDIRFVNKNDREILCPEKLATVVSLGNDLEHRELTGIVHAPYVKKNWEIFETRGYDPETGLFSMIEQKVLTPLQYPVEAYNFLKDIVLAEFPFREELDVVVMIGAMMALLQRPILAQDPAGMPGFAVVAPVQSSGKTTLIHLATTAILKTAISASSFSNDDEEFRKHLLSLLMEGHTCVLFDNVAHGTEVKSDSLAKAMSSEIYSDRTLGVNKTLSVASAAIWFFTGNNITFSGDFSTRVYPIHLNPKMEDPDQRRFKRDNILEWIFKERQNIIRALISIIWAGKDIKPLETGSRFKIWDKYIRGPLFEVTGIDVNAAISANKQNDMDFINKKNLISAMFERFENNEVTSRGLIASGWNEDNDKANAIGELLEDILGKYAKNTKSLGRLLSRMVGRTYGGLVLSRIDTDRAFWKVEEVKE